MPMTISRAPAILTRFTVRLEASPEMSEELLVGMLNRVDSTRLRQRITTLINQHLRQYHIAAQAIVTE